MNLRGTFTAMITPFHSDHQLDEEGLICNIQRQLEAKVAGLVLLGTTGEAMTLTEVERHRVVKIGVREAGGHLPIIVGTGGNSTRQTIENTHRAQEWGADAALIVAPYYNKPTQEGIYCHFEAISSAVDLPLLVYNVPSRCGVNIETATLRRIAALPGVVGVKEASGSMAQIADQLSSRPSFELLSGDDALTLPMMALGASGVISVVSNLLPERVVALVQYALEARFMEARAVHEELLPLFQTAFIETNPVPIKEAMALCGLAAGPCRLPLCPLRQENRARLEQQLRERGWL